MGDGHHVWAAAEWVMMIRHCFVREEDDHLVLCAGIPQRWLEPGKRVSFGPAPTVFGDITIDIAPRDDAAIHIAWQPQWRGEAPPVEVRPPGFRPARVEPETCAATLSRTSEPA